MRMVAHGAMATAGKVENELQHYVPLGSIVMCVDPYANKIEGELVAMDEPTGMIIIKSVSNDQKEDLTVLNRELLTEFEVKKYAPNNTRGAFMPERIVSESAVRKAIVEKEEAINRVGPKDVSLAGRELFKVINKTYTNLEWRGNVIQGLDGDFFVHPPYKSNDVKGNTEDAVARIKKVVDKFHQDFVKKHGPQSDS